MSLTPLATETVVTNAPAVHPSHPKAKPPMTLLHHVRRLRVLLARAITTAATGR